MSSILTNESATVALQTLRSINADLAKTQSEISTGKTVATAKDNSAIWAISKVMESDVKGFNAISDSLSLGESTIAVARDASETVSDLLTDIKGKIVSAQEENVDREKLQADIDELTSQVESVVNAAQFNGLNLLKGTEDMTVLSSLDRANDGTVTASNITVERQDMTFTKAEFGTGAALTAPTLSGGGAVANTANTVTVGVAGTFDGTGEAIIDINGTEITFAEGADAAATQTNLINAINSADIEGVTAAAGTGTAVTVSSVVAFDETTVELKAGTSAVTAVAEQTIAERAETATFGAAPVAEGDSYRITLGANNYEYVANDGDTLEDIARGLDRAINAGGDENITTQVRQNDAGLWEIAVDNDGTSVAFTSIGNAAGGTAAGGMAGLEDIDVTNSASAEAALSAIEDLIQVSIDAAASFGSAQGRIETQSTFISDLTDSLQTGIGSMVDADMEEASARLQALQTQQQLGVEALSIANQAPQSILSLFR